jgi:hypothetical protein
VRRPGPAAAAERVARRAAGNNLRRRRRCPFRDNLPDAHALELLKGRNDDAANTRVIHVERSVRILDAKLPCKRSRHRPKLIVWDACRGRYLHDG